MLGDWFETSELISWICWNPALRGCGIRQRRGPARVGMAGLGPVMATISLPKVATRGVKCQAWECAS